MGEIAMTALPAELMSAMNIFACSADMTQDLTANGAQNGSFGAVLGLLMSNTAPIQTVPEITETETDTDTTAADILLAALTGEDETELPEIFSESGAKAFIETVSRFFEECDTDKLREDISFLWKSVSPEEKSAFAELLYAAADISEDESIETEKSPADIVRMVSELVVKAAKKPEKKASEKSELTDEALLLQGMNLLRPVQTVSYDCTPNETSEITDAVSTDYRETGIYPEANTAQAADTEIPVQNDISEGPRTAKGDDVPLTDIQTAYEKLSEAEPEEIISFCRKLADELNGSVKGSAPEAVTADKAESADTDHIGYGRQGMQGFMARVNRHEELPNDSNAEILSAQTTEKNAAADVEFSERVPESEDIPSQIMRQIDLYRDIFQNTFSEKEISMKLSPESLGGVEIKIKRSDSGFEITFTAEKAEAAELIGNKASELADALASRGIALKELSVTRQIVTNESDGSLSGENLSGNGDLYGGAHNGQSGSGRSFSFTEQNVSDVTSEQTDESSSEINFNKEAKLWVSA